MHCCALPLHDPAEHTSHLGFCDMVCESCWRVDKEWWRVTAAKVAAALAQPGHPRREIHLHFWCKSGRHRSVASAMIFAGAIAGMEGFRVHRMCHHGQFWWQFVPCQRAARTSGNACQRCSEVPGPGRQRISDEVRAIIVEEMCRVRGDAEFQ